MAFTIRSDERLNGNKVRMYTVTTALHHGTESSGQHSKSKEIKGV